MKTSVVVGAVSEGFEFEDAVDVPGVADVVTFDPRVKDLLYEVTVDVSNANTTRTCQ